MKRAALSSAACCCCCRSCHRRGHGRSRRRLGVSLGQPTAEVEQIAGIPPEYLQLFEAAGARYGIPWEVLAGIGKVECDDGQDPDPSCTQEGAVNYAGAGGPMQFLASTWAAYGGQRQRQRPADRWNPADAIFTRRAATSARPAHRANCSAQSSPTTTRPPTSKRSSAGPSIYESQAQLAVTATPAGGAAGTALSFALAQIGVPVRLGRGEPERL